MINSLKNNGFNVTNYSDIVDRGLPGVEIADFLEAEKKELICFGESSVKLKKSIQEGRL